MKRSLLFLLASMAATSAETLLSTRDTDVYSFRGPNGSPTSTIYTLGVSSTPTTSTTLHSQKSLIQFNIAALTIPAAEIGAAKLRLYLVPPNSEFGPQGAGNVHVHYQATAWGTITDTYPIWTTFQSGGQIGVIPIATDSAGWVEVDITAAVVAWKSGAVANNGLFLAPLTDKLSPALNVTFASMDIPGNPSGPQIVVTRKPPVLAVSAAGGNITVKWPVSGSEGWVLQRSTTLVGPWTTNAVAASNVGGNWQVQSANVGREFFRLVIP